MSIKVKIEKECAGAEGFDEIFLTGSAINMLKVDPCSSRCIDELDFGRNVRRKAESEREYSRGISFLLGQGFLLFTCLTRLIFQPTEGANLGKRIPIIRFSWRKLDSGPGVKQCFIKIRF